MANSTRKLTGVKRVYAYVAAALVALLAHTTHFFAQIAHKQLPLSYILSNH